MPYPLKSRTSWETNPATRSDGRKVAASPHARGDSFDVTGAPLEAIQAALKKANGDGKESFIFLPEPVNDCIHVQLLP